MKKIYFRIFLLFFIVFSLHANDFETNFLQSYLNFEQFFLNIGGDYGTTFFPFLNNGYGGRETALSGAFTAVADDINTLETNPAGTASLKFTELSFSHNKLMGDVNYNSLAYTMRLNDLGLGVGTRILYIPFTHYDPFGEDVGNGVISYTVFTLNASYNFLRSYEFFGLSIGGNVKLYLYSVPENIAADQTRVNVAFDFGLLTRFNFLKAYKKTEKNFSVGLALRNFGPFTDPLTEKEPPPSLVALGIAYKPIEQLLISIDFNYLINYSAMTYKNWVVRSGLEWKFTKYSSLLGGVVIKSNPSFSVGINLNFDDFTVTASYNPDFSDVAKFSISASLKFGDLGRGQKQELIRKMYATALRLVSEGNYQDAKILLEKIILKDSTFTPAKKSLKNTINQLKIEEKFNELNTNDNVLQ